MPLRRFLPRTLPHLIIWGASLVQLAGLYRLPELRFFADSDVRDRQATELSRSGFREACSFPARRVLPDLPPRFFPGAYVTFRGTHCDYWFSRPGAVWFALNKTWGGRGGILIVSQLLVVLLAYWLWWQARLWGLSFGWSIFALLVFRFGTAASLAGTDIEIHLAQTTLCVGLFSLATQRLRVGQTSVTGAVLLGALVGLLAGLSFALRPEGLALLAVLPFWLWTRSAAVAGLPSKSEPPLPFVLTAIGAGLFAVGLVTFWKLQRFGHPLGVKIHDPVHTASGGLGERLLRLGEVFFYYKEWPLNSLFLQMPLFALSFAAVWLVLRDWRARAAPQGVRAAIWCVPLLLPLGLIAPDNLGGPYVGYRFAFFLVPLLILLAVWAAQQLTEKLGKARQTWPRRFAVLLIGLLALPGLASSLGSLYVARQVYGHYLQVHRTMRQVVTSALPPGSHSGSFLITRTPLLNGSLSDLFFRRPVAFASSEEDLRWLVEQLRQAGVKRVVIFATDRPTAPAELVSDWRRSAIQVAEEQPTSVLRWRLLTLPGAGRPSK